MAVFKSIRQKNKEYVFQVFDNEKSKEPAKVVFHRFPLTDELFPIASQKNVLETFKNFDNSKEMKEELVTHIIDTMVENITANRFDHIRFIKECIDHFENLIYDDKEIKTVPDFLSLPEEAVQKISKDIYLYSKIEDEFTMGESEA